MTLAESLRTPELGIARRDALDVIDALRQASTISLHRLLATVNRYLDGTVSARELADVRDDIRRTLAQADAESSYRNNVQSGGTTC